MRFHIIAGLPRSGSTLLCNILNQNPAFHATSESALSYMISGITDAWSSSLDVRNLLDKEKEQTLNRMHKSCISFIESWYGDIDSQVVFDKSRGWNTSFLTFKSFFPKAKVIVLIRDLRGILASIEKQYLKTPFLNESLPTGERTLLYRVNQQLSETGIIGSSLSGINDMINRRIKDMVVIKYETLSTDPDIIMERVYQELGMPVFKHDFGNVKKTTIEPDGFMLHKYPHEGTGKVKPYDPDEWRKYIPEEMVNNVMKNMESYNKKFGYK